jgi:serine/threonine protein phosphatase PrpC
MMLLPGNAIHIGKRQEQQDAFALSDFEDRDFVEHGGYLAVIADGMGGLSYGAEAAELTVTQFLASYQSKTIEQSIPASLDQALQCAQQAVLHEAERLHCLEEMGSTLVAAVIHQNQLYWRAVGDSHLYLFRDQRLSQLNPDHNYARNLQTQVEAGLISQTQADNHPDRQALEYFIGLNPLPQTNIQHQPIVLKPHDKLLLCSDGVDGFLSTDRLITCLQDAPMLAAQRICDEVLALNHPYQDNLTAIVLGFQT